MNFEHWVAVIHLAVKRKAPPQARSIIEALSRDRTGVAGQLHRCTAGGGHIPLPTAGRRWTGSKHMTSQTFPSHWHAPSREAAAYTQCGLRLGRHVPASQGAGAHERGHTFRIAVTTRQL